MNGKTYIYKLYEDNAYAGLIDTVVSEFQMREEINTAGSQVELELGVYFNGTSASIDTDLLVDENGDNIITDTNDNIATDAVYSFSGIPKLNSRVEIWEIDDIARHYTVVAGDTIYNIAQRLGHDWEEMVRLNDLANPDLIIVGDVLTLPQARKVFTGLVSKWTTDSDADTVKVTLLSYGVRLDNFLVQVLPSEAITENVFQDSSQSIFGAGKGFLSVTNGVYQSFQVASDTDITSIRVYIENTNPNPAQLVLQLFEGDSPTTTSNFLGDIFRDVPAFSADYVEFSFPSTVSVTATTDYLIGIFNQSVSSGESVEIGVDTTGSYASGTFYTFNPAIGVTTTTDSMTFAVITATGADGNVYNSYDPSDIMRSLINNMQSLTSQLSYTDESIATSGSVVSYTFRFNTYLDAIKKTAELAPADWWWYVDPANGLVYFQPKGNTPDHTFVKGREMHFFSIAYSLENMKNKVYFTGGEVAGENLLVKVENNTSVSRYGSWLDLPIDNRVTLEDTATILATSRLSEHSSPEFITEVTILAVDYDITSIRIGDMVGFANFNEVIDSLVLQVVGKDLSPDKVVLQLALLPPTQNKRVEDIRRNLKLAETENSPNA